MISDEDLERAPVREVAEDRLTARKRLARVEAELPDLTEFLDTLHAGKKME